MDGRMEGWMEGEQSIMTSSHSTFIIFPPFPKQNKLVRSVVTVGTMLAAVAMLAAVPAGTTAKAHRGARSGPD